ncbi:Uncharacterised protein [uncultured archaeon]|nr:Uncharacterised protein [uncultured archaeon]
MKKEKPLKEALEKDALNRIRYDSSLKPAEYSILYLDLDVPKEIQYTNVIIKGDFFALKGGEPEALIPMHRIREIRRNGKTVWNKRRLKGQ